MFAADVYKLIEGSADAAFVVTLEGEICFWNTAAERLFGFRAVDVLNRTCDEVLQGTGVLSTVVCTRDCTVQRCAARSDSIPAFDLEVTTAPGERKWVNVSTLVFDDSRLHRRLIVHLSRDIGARKEAEQTLSKLLDVSRQIISIGTHQSEQTPVDALSDQQRRILALFAEARSSAEVAKELGITVPTLRNHLHAINRKLRTHNRLEAVLHAIKRGLI